jgi:predicted RNase H-like nuclease (RuvC/YqgF family)
MEVNTVVISLDRLKELELAEKKVNEPRSKTIVIERHMFGSYTVETDDKCAEKLANDLKEAKEKIDELKSELENPKKEEVVEITIGDVKKMNYWDFRKWKRS